MIYDTGCSFCAPAGLVLTKLKHDMFPLIQCFPLFKVTLQIGAPLNSQKLNSKEYNTFCEPGPPYLQTTESFKCHIIFTSTYLRVQIQDISDIVCISIIRYKCKNLAGLNDYDAGVSLRARHQAN